VLEAPPVVSRAPRRNDSAHHANAAWSLAPLIAGQPVYRLGRRINGSVRYQRSATPHHITASRPSAPAAVMIHDVDGSVRTLCLDLDTSRAARRAAVDADAARLGQLLRTAGLAFVEDRSPSGGRHLYVPLQEPITAADARQLVEALQLHAPSLDPTPHQNVTDGCIRVPGSAHKLGGHQMLITPLTEAYGILHRRNPVTALTALRQALAPELHRLEQDKRRQQRTAADAIATLRASDATGRSTSLTRVGERSALRSVAITGVYDTSTYPSDSEARMAVLNHFAGCGWTVDQVRAGMADQLAGLTALYGDSHRVSRPVRGVEDASELFYTRRRARAQCHHWCLLQDSERGIAGCRRVAGSGQAHRSPIPLRDRWNWRVVHSGASSHFGLRTFTCFYCPIYSDSVGD
jgi:hypothetical protein